MTARSAVEREAVVLVVDDEESSVVVVDEVCPSTEATSLSFSPPCESDQLSSRAHPERVGARATTASQRPVLSRNVLRSMSLMRIIYPMAQKTYPASALETGRAMHSRVVRCLR
jgi:hypothetical protein